MSNRGDFVGTAPDSGNYIPAPVPADKEDLPVYVNDELLRLGGTVNGVLEGGALPPHSKLPKRFKEGMIMNFSGDVGGGVDSSGVWLYKKAKWWKLIDDPTTITDEIYERIEEVEEEINGIDQELIDLNLELDNLNDKTLPALQGELDNLNYNTLPALQGELDAVETDLGNLNRNVIPNIRGDLTQANRDLSSLEGRFPIAETDIQNGSISTPKLQANSVNADKIVANSITTGKLVASAVTADKLAANSVNADKIVANSITGDKIRANTINGDRIIANTINGDRIVANTINGNRIIANTFSGDKIVANSIKGDKIIANSITGGKINSASTITAGSGNKSASLNGSDSTWRLYAGSSNPAAAPFRVDKDGNLFASSGTFGGKIFASQVSGDFTDFKSKKAALTYINKPYPEKNVLFTVYIDTSTDYNRVFRIDPLIMSLNTSNRIFRFVLYRTPINANKVVTGPTVVAGVTAFYAERQVTKTEITYADIPANSHYRIDVSVEETSTSGNKGGSLMNTAMIYCMLFKQGNSMSIS